MEKEKQKKRRREREREKSQFVAEQEMIRTSEFQNGKNERKRK